jgi:hypothetical protein
MRIAQKALLKPFRMHDDRKSGYPVPLSCLARFVPFSQSGQSAITEMAKEQRHQRAKRSPLTDAGGRSVSGEIQREEERIA